MTDLRDRQLDKLRRRVMDGNYRVDPVAVADAILSRGLGAAPRPRRQERSTAPGEQAAVASAGR